MFFAQLLKCLNSDCILIICDYLNDECVLHQDSLFLIVQAISSIHEAQLLVEAVDMLHVLLLEFKKVEKIQTKEIIGHLYISLFKKYKVVQHIEILYYLRDVLKFESLDLTHLINTLESCSWLSLYFKSNIKYDN